MIAAAACGLVVAAGSGVRGALVQGFQMSGQLGYELTGIAVPGGPGNPVSGTIMVNNIPPGAMVQAAFLYANDFAGPGIGGGSLDFAFGPAPNPPTPLGSGLPTSQDPVTAPLAFGYELLLPPTSVVGNGGYNVQIAESSSILGGNANQLAGAGLLVIYSDPLLPVSTITVNHGVRILGAGGMASSASSTFAEASATIPAGIGNLSILTFADDPATSGETIGFNGNPNIGGPLDSNLPPGGGSASVLNFTGLTTLGGGNDTVTVNSTGDIFGWHVAVLQSTIPEPSTGGLVMLAAVMLLGRHRRRAG